MSSYCQKSYSSGDEWKGIILRQAYWSHGLQKCYCSFKLYEIKQRDIHKFVWLWTGAVEQLNQIILVKLVLNTHWYHTAERYHTAESQKSHTERFLNTEYVQCIFSVCALTSSPPSKPSNLHNIQQQAKIRPLCRTYSNYTLTMRILKMT